MGSGPEFGSAGFGFGFVSRLAPMRFSNNDSTHHKEFQVTTLGTK